MAKKVLFWESSADSSEFLKLFLSNEMTSSTLVSLINLSGNSIGRSERKEALVSRVAGLLGTGEIVPSQILQEYVRMPRMWLAIKLGKHAKEPRLRDPNLLLRNFGDAGWYGPVKNNLDGSSYYIYTKRVSEPIEYDKDTNRITKSGDYRWSVIAKISEGYVALHWYGFGYKEDPGKKANQFPFWKYIPSIFEELEHLTGATWQEPDLYNLMLDKLWNKYLDDITYADTHDWSHLRIKAESSGVALNARSSMNGPSEISLKGLLALADALARSALTSLSEHSETAIEVDLDEKEITREILKNALLKALIKD